MNKGWNISERLILSEGTSRVETNWHMLSSIDAYSPFFFLLVESIQPGFLFDHLMENYGYIIPLQKDTYMRVPRLSETYMTNVGWEFLGIVSVSYKSFYLIFFWHTLPRNRQHQKRNIVSKENNFANWHIFSSHAKMQTNTHKFFCVCISFHPVKKVIYNGFSSKGGKIMTFVEIW